MERRFLVTIVIDDETWDDAVHRHVEKALENYEFPSEVWFDVCEETPDADTTGLAERD